jgi:hypothetical protein
MLDASENMSWACVALMNKQRRIWGNEQYSILSCEWGGRNSNIDWFLVKCWSSIKCSTGYQHENSPHTQPWRLNWNSAPFFSPKTWTWCTVSWTQRVSQNTETWMSNKRSLNPEDSLETTPATSGNRNFSWSPWIFALVSHTLPPIVYLRNSIILPFNSLSKVNQS